MVENISHPPTVFALAPPAQGFLYASNLLSAPSPLDSNGLLKALSLCAELLQPSHRQKCILCWMWPEVFGACLALSAVVLPDRW